MNSSSMVRRFLTMAILITGLQTAILPASASTSDEMNGYVSKLGDEGIALYGSCSDIAGKLILATPETLVKAEASELIVPFENNAIRLDQYEPAVIRYDADFQMYLLYAGKREPGSPISAVIAIAVRGNWMYVAIGLGPKHFGENATPEVLDAIMSGEPSSETDCTLSELDLQEMYRNSVTWQPTDGEGIWR